MIKNFMIFGDSYSTHKDVIPEGYAHYYCTGGRSEKEPVTNMRPEETWWGRFMAKTGANLVHNNSWSGSTVCFKGWSGDCSTTSSFIYRYEKLTESGFFEKNEIDTIFVLGTTNDSWIGVPLGEEKYSDFKREEFYNVLPALCYFMTKLREDHPDKRIVMIANCGIKPEIVDCMRNGSERLGLDFVELHDIDKMSGHPTVIGMDQISDRIIEKLKIEG